MTYDFREDGITHINIYSKGNSTLGRLLSNFAHSPFVCHCYGEFNTLEGYWFYIRTDTCNKSREALRTACGYIAKGMGSKMHENTIAKDEFKSLIKRAMRLKIKSNSELYKLLKNSSLPFTHYYVYNNRRVEAGFEWLVEEWETIRKEMQSEPR